MADIEYLLLYSIQDNVEGQDCGACKPGYFNLDINNRFGCVACFCNGKTSQCSSAEGYTAAYIISYFDTGMGDLIHSV